MQSTAPRSGRAFRRTGNLCFVSASAGIPSAAFLLRTILREIKPAGTLVHSDAPSLREIGDDHPSGHSVQSPDPSDSIPSEHLKHVVQLSCGAYRPGGHLVQTVEPFCERMSRCAPHATSTLRFCLIISPGQSMHLVMPPLPCLPAGHSTCVVELILSWPGWTALQSGRPSLPWWKPRGQSLHCADALSFVNLPGGHLLQLVEPICEAYEPMSHPMQLLPSVSF